MAKKINMNNKPTRNELVKRCIKCDEKKRLIEYYSNPKWQEEMYRDRWCKECAKKLIVNESVLQEYFEDNRRVYPQNFWKKMFDKAKDIVKNEKPYLMGREKEQLIFKYTIGNIFKLMNFKGYYKLIETQYIKEDKEVIEADIIKDERIKKYSEKWHGYYTDDDIRYLEAYYAGLDNDFRLSNHNYRDYAMKVCKASLAMDNAFSNMQMGVENAAKDYKETKAIFDGLSQSAKFAEKSRSVNDVVGFGSLGELINGLEENGFLMEEIRFPDDDIDLIVDDFRYIIASVGEKF